MLWGVARAQAGHERVTSEQVPRRDGAWHAAVGGRARVAESDGGPDSLCSAVRQRVRTPARSPAPSAHCFADSRAHCLYRATSAHCCHRAASAHCFTASSSSWCRAARADVQAGTVWEQDQSAAKLSVRDVRQDAARHNARAGKAGLAAHVSGCEEMDTCACMHVCEEMRMCASLCAVVAMMDMRCMSLQSVSTWFRAAVGSVASALLCASSFFSLFSFCPRTTTCLSTVFRSICKPLQPRTHPGWIPATHFI